MKAPWSHLAAATGGVIVGAAIVRSEPVWHWLRGADWSQLPATAVGASVPAAAGFFLARALAVNSVHTIKAAELQAQHDFDSEQQAAEIQAGVDRAAAWNTVFDLSTTIDEETDGDGTFSKNLGSDFGLSDGQS
ncbi:MAG: hypothetical protein JWN99_1220 [Ilumatobacteraceae bacterium]|nr:hypothetical protein [Ilumatobacteraceae bacterium]